MKRISFIVLASVVLASCRTASPVMPVVNSRSPLAAQNAVSMQRVSTQRAKANEAILSRLQEDIESSSTGSTAEIFARMDRNENGRVTVSELVNFMKNLNDGSYADKLPVGDKIKYAQYLIDMLDKNKDGQMSLKEYINSSAAPAPPVAYPPSPVPVPTPYPAVPTPYPGYNTPPDYGYGYPYPGYGYGDGYGYGYPVSGPTAHPSAYPAR